jgi:hypothetical protein
MIVEQFWQKFVPTYSWANDKFVQKNLRNYNKLIISESNYRRLYAVTSKLRRSRACRVLVFFFIVVLCIFSLFSPQGCNACIYFLLILDIGVFNAIFKV